MFPETIPHPSETVKYGVIIGQDVSAIFGFPLGPWDLTRYSAATSRLFKFLVGKDKREFTIHAALLASQSPALDAVVMGDFKESAERCVEWPDVNEDTFTSFWQYIYTGDYHSMAVTSPASAASSDCQPTPSQSRASAVEYGDRSWNEGPAVDGERVDNDLLNTAGRMRKQQVLWANFQWSWTSELELEVVERETGFASYGDMLVHHAKVYVLADRYIFTGLVNASFKKLHEALVQFDASDNATDGATDLVRFCYTGLVPERLTRMVIHFAACKMEIMWKNETFQALVKEDGDLSAALITSMMLRID
ncbi:hypothetical protein QQS21_008691 [Conoideocrella luteorostrata]|uniref:BTB domain-containing protein n=1 Tax=Conoideocrella luteorostrata TaxID=1105319 RepID=A0AAJ0CIC6_9HYPO|nr:hypothetical protein QQS21_008691 [Conoideocrella luteorostrata]